MADRYYNPFQVIDISVPIQFREEFARYCQTRTEGTRSLIDNSPFPRMIDMWFLAICVATKEKMKPVDFSDQKTYKIIEGSILSSDPWRINLLMLLCIGLTGNIEIVNNPREMMKLANELAVAGLPKLIVMLKDGDLEPIWNLSDSLESILRNKVPK